MTNVEKLLEELRARPEADELLRECGASDYAEALLSVAGQLGIETEVDAEEIRAYLREAEASRRASTDQVIGEVAELDDDDLEAVAGGRAGIPLPDCPSGRWDDFWACLVNETCSRTWYCRDFMI